jgi:hypothetical protein
MPTPQDIAERYVALWNETDAVRRRQLVEAFFAPGAEHYVRAREAIGYDALEQRVTGSHEKNVRDAGNSFRAAPGAQQLKNVVTFHWEMTAAEDLDKVVAVGLEFVTIDEQRRAVADYQFIVG